jgi:hypothetical protein
MTEKQAEFIREACECAGLECAVHNDYSGRGMFGKTTHAASVPNLLGLLGAVVDLLKLCGDRADLDEAPRLNGLHWDELGRDVIVY